MPRRNWTGITWIFTHARADTCYTNVVEDWQTNSEQAVKRTRSWRISWRARRATPSHDWVIRHGKRTTWRGEPTMHLTIHSRHTDGFISWIFPLCSFHRLHPNSWLNSTRNDSIQFWYRSTISSFFFINVISPWQPLFLKRTTEV